MKHFVKQAFCSVKAETSFFLDALDFRLDLGIRQNIIRQLLQWAISPKFSPSKILYCIVLLTSGCKSAAAQYKGVIIWRLHKVF